MHARDGPGSELADHGDLVGRRLRDPVPGLIDVDERSAEIHNRGKVRELAEHVVDDVQAVAERDREQVGPVGFVEHVCVRLDDPVARDRQPDHGS